MKRIIAVSLLVLALSGCGVEYSDGSRSGSIYKISRKGVIWKTWEGEMNVGGVATNANGMVVPNIWYFSVMDEQVVRQVQAAQDSGNRVKLHYKQYMAVWPSWGKTGYIIENVESLNKS